MSDRPPASAAPDPTPLVDAAVRGRLGHLRLSRPEKINALNAGMVEAVRASLHAWRGDPQVAAVLIDGAGDRGLCAGGDIAAVFRGIRDGGPAPAVFWADEYRMNLDIADYPKPVVTLMHGITFGGGIGIGGHALIRAVTDDSLLAMPETGIGLSPDVGGLYLLARAPGELGTHAALTGARIGPGDAITAGLADFFVPRAALAGLPAALATITRPHDASLVVSAAATAPPPSEFWAANSDWVNRCYVGDDPRRILRRLKSHRSAAARSAGAALAGMSPTAVAVTLRALRNAAHMSLAEVLDQDLMLSTHFAAHHDFPEGIRAQIIDKDRHPKWNPARLDDVEPGSIDAFFAMESTTRQRQSPRR